MLGKSLVQHVLKENVESLAEGFEQEVQQFADNALDSAVDLMLLSVWMMFMGAVKAP